MVLKSRESLALELEGGDVLNIVRGEALLTLGDESALGVGQGDDGAAELDDLESSVLSDVAGSGQSNALALERLLTTAGVCDHVLNVVDETVTGGLRTDERSTPCATLAGKNTLPAVALSPVCAEEVSNLASTNADVARGNVCVGTCDLRKSNVHWKLNTERQLGENSRRPGRPEQR